MAEFSQNSMQHLVVKVIQYAIFHGHLKHFNKKKSCILVMIYLKLQRETDM